MVALTVSSYQMFLVAGNAFSGSHITDYLHRGMIIIIILSVIKACGLLRSHSSGVSKNSLPARLAFKFSVVSSGLSRWNLVVPKEHTASILKDTSALKM